MIKGMHGLFYTPEAEAVRAFFRDKLEIPHVDAGGGWLIFAVPKAEFGIHPGERPHHELSLFCDDIEGTTASLRDRGVTFKGGIEDAGWGRVATMEVPGGLEVLLYEPKHEQP